MRNKVSPLIYNEVIGTNQFKNVLLINKGVKNYQTFVNSVNSDTFPIVYSLNSTKVELLELLHRMFSIIERIGFVFYSYGDSKTVFLDKKSWFENTEVAPYSENLKFILDIIAEFQIKNMDFLACDTLNYPTWTNYYEILTQSTCVIIGASNDKTGNIKYGGDWVLESTSQDIEQIYFDHNISYYTFLLDNPTWATIIDFLYVDSPHGLGITNTHIYVALSSFRKIIKININDPTDIDNNWVTQDTFYNSFIPIAMAIDSNNEYMYIGMNSGRIIKLNIADPTIHTYYWASIYFNSINGIVFTSPGNLINSLVIDNTNTYLYVLKSNNTIDKITIETQNINSSWLSEGISLYLYILDVSYSFLNIHVGFVIDKTNTYMYVTNQSLNTITRIEIADPNNYNNEWATSEQGLDFPCGLVIDNTNTYMYVLNNDNNYISQIKLSDTNIFNPIYAPLIGDSYQEALIIDKTNTYLYVLNTSARSLSRIDLPIVCFKEDTKILTNKGYIKIQDLRKGALVKTFKDGYKPIHMIGKREMYHPAVEERLKTQLYNCSKNEYPELIEDLVITGCHSILVDKIKSTEQRAKIIEINGNVYITDTKARLPACVDTRATVYKTPGVYNIYHFSLDNTDYYMNYGVYANGLLVETCSKRYLKELSNMTIIE